MIILIGHGDQVSSKRHAQVPAYLKPGGDQGVTMSVLPTDGHIAARISRMLSHRTLRTSLRTPQPFHLSNLVFACSADRH
jgi:hypothetical protein